MKIGGVEVTSNPCRDVLVLPRPTGKDVVIEVQAVVNFEEFEAICPKPTPPKMVVKGGTKENWDSDSFKEASKRYAENRFDFLCLKSLEPAEIEWVTVDENKPNTWNKWQDDLAEYAGFSATEVNRVVQKILEVNSLDESKLKAARDAFLRGQVGEQEKPSGQSTEQPSTQSGEPANGSA